MTRRFWHNRLTGRGTPPAGGRRARRHLETAGVNVTVRDTRGDDIDAACGQLAGDVRDRTRVAGRIARQRTITLKPVTTFATEHEKDD